MGCILHVASLLQWVLPVGNNVLFRVHVKKKNFQESHSDFINFFLLLLI